jgi:geranylgeranyl reductase family protein
MMYDVIIVGAGPGGASAAYGLANAGVRVLMLEKEKIPRYKPCGGGLTSKVRDALPFDFSPAIEDTITQTSIGFRAERARISIDQAWCVMRDKFDALLAERAVHAGAELRDAEPVSQIDFGATGATITTQHEKLNARFVIGADGVNGVVRRAAGFPAHTRMGVALEAEMEASSRALEEWRGTLHLDFGAIAWGYAWIFPKAEHLSVGIGELMRPNHATNLRAELTHYIASEPSLQDAKTRFTRGHRVPLGGVFARYHAPRAVLVGDSAGIVDPFTAEGIYYAIKSGQMAAAEVIAAFARGDFDLANYTRRVNAEINADFRYAWWITQLFYHMPHFAYRVFVQSASVQTAATNTAQGNTTYREMIVGTLAKWVQSLMPFKRAR